MQLTYLVRYVMDTNGKHKGDEEERTIKNAHQIVISDKYIYCYNRKNQLAHPPIPLHGIFTEVLTMFIE